MRAIAFLERDTTVPLTGTALASQNPLWAFLVFLLRGFASDLDGGRDARCRVFTFVPGGRQGGQPTVNLEESCVLKIKGTREK
jgi:hypothetical protein